jgi:hypothetical protein
VGTIVLAVEAVVGETTIAAIHGSRANRAGSFVECTRAPVRLPTARRR